MKDKKPYITLLFILLVIAHMSYRLFVSGTGNNMLQQSHTISTPQQIQSPLPLENNTSSHSVSNTTPPNNPSHLLKSEDPIYVVQ